MKIIVSRVTGNFEVTAFADFDIIGAQMELNDFLQILASTVGEKDLAPKLLAAVPKVLDMMKKETAKVVV